MPTGCCLASGNFSRRKIETGADPSWFFSKAFCRISDSVFVRCAGRCGRLQSPCCRSPLGSAQMSRSSRFSTLLLKPIPVRDPRQIVILSRPGKDNSNQAENTGGFSFPALEQFRRFSSAGVIASSSIDEVRVIAGGTANFGRGEAVSGNSHAVLGVAPLIGRLLADADDREAAAPCASWAIAFGLATLAAMRRLSGKRSFRDMCRPRRQWLASSRTSLPE